MSETQNDFTSKSGVNLIHFVPILLSFNSQNENISEHYASIMPKNINVNDPIPLAAHFQNINTKAVQTLQGVLRALNNDRANLEKLGLSKSSAACQESLNKAITIAEQQPV